MAQKYFNQLNYSLGNEDTSVDLEIVKRLGSQHIFSVAGCGSRSFPLLEQASELTMGDVSSYQLSLCRLRESLYQRGSFEDFLLFFEFPPYHGQDNSYRRKEIFHELELEYQDKEFFHTLFRQLDWGSLLYQGKWERTFQTMSKGLRFILGKDYSKIFEFYNLEEQIRFFEKEFNQTRWKSLLFLLGNKSVFNTLLYKGDFIKKNVEENHFEYYEKSFHQLFTHSLARESFFAHLCFFGEITHSDGNPIEAHKENFEAVCRKVKGKECAHYHNGDLVEFLEKDDQKESFDYIGLSDVPSYFEGDLEKNFLQRISSSLKNEGVVCLRNYLRVPECDHTDFVDISHNFEDVTVNEKVGVYRFQVLQKTS